MCGVNLVKNTCILAAVVLLSAISAIAEAPKVLKDRYVVTRVPEMSFNTSSARKYGGFAKKKNHAGYIGFTEVEGIEIEYQSSLEAKKENEVVELNADEADSWCKVLKSYDPSVIDCEPDYYFELQTVESAYTPTDPNYSNIKANLNSMSVREAWDITKGSSNVLVAVIDTGVDYNHEDLAANIAVNSGEIAGDGIDNDNNGYVDDVVGYDLYSNDSDPSDEHYHGTHVAGTIGAVMDNGLGMAGVSPNVGIVPVRVMSPRGSGSYSKILAGVNYAIARGVDVMNMSIGGFGSSVDNNFTLLGEAMESARQAGIIIVAAAGNYTDDVDQDPTRKLYPAAFTHDNIISVASIVAADNSVSSFSNYGTSSVDIAAPGSSVLSTYPGDLYAYLSGTSMAAPHVAGAIALLKAAYPSASYSAIKTSLLNNADANPNFGGAIKTLTNGNANVLAAIQNFNSNGGTGPGSDEISISFFGLINKKDVAKSVLKKKKNFYMNFESDNNVLLSFEFLRGSKVLGSCNFSKVFSSGMIAGVLNLDKSLKAITHIRGSLFDGGNSASITSKVRRGKKLKRKKRRKRRSRLLSDACGAIEASLTQ